MDIILHLGAHRTATTSFQHYVRDHRCKLMRHRIGFWGPQHTRNAVFPGLFKNRATVSDRDVVALAESRVNLLVKSAAASGFKSLLISDENLLGTCAQNLRTGQLYPQVRRRMRCLDRVFGARLSRIVLSIRSQDMWWPSAFALTWSKCRVPTRTPNFGQATLGVRRWQHVIEDIARAAPQAELIVLPFERFAGRPHAKLRAATGIDLPPDRQERWLNASTKLLSDAALPSDRKQPMLGQAPFASVAHLLYKKRALLRAAYLEDLRWLAAGADGLATLQENGLHKPVYMRQSGTGRQQRL